MNSTAPASEVTLKLLNSEFLLKETFLWFLDPLCKHSTKSPPPLLPSSSLSHPPSLSPSFSLQSNNFQTKIQDLFIFRKCCIQPFLSFNLCCVFIFMTTASAKAARHWSKGGCDFGRAIREVKDRVTDLNKNQWHIYSVLEWVSNHLNQSWYLGNILVVENSEVFQSSPLELVYIWLVEHALHV